jgi:pimeloyl-ACP methyl ester carboxylesterase
MLKLATRRGDNLSVVLFPRDMQTLPTVLYLHGNGGGKLEVLSLVRQGFDLNFCAFDFSGCGSSEGEFVTYGEKEVEDIETVVQFLADYFGVRTVALWGRRYYLSDIAWAPLWV